MHVKQILIAGSLVAIVACAIIYSNMELRSGLGAGNSWGMTWSYTQGWPFPQRELQIQETYSANIRMVSSAATSTKVLESTWIPIGILLNSTTALVLLSSVAATYRIWPRTKLGRMNFGLLALLFSFCVIAIITASYANGLSGASILADLFDDHENYFHYVDMPKWHTLVPIAFAITCAGYVTLRSIVYLWNRTRGSNSTPIAG